jgi:hypothetical protein
MILGIMILEHVKSGNKVLFCNAEAYHAESIIKAENELGKVSGVG